MAQPAAGSSLSGSVGRVWVMVIMVLLTGIWEMALNRRTPIALLEWK